MKRPALFLALPFAVPGTFSKGEVNTCTPLSDMGPETTSLAIEFRNSSMTAAVDDVVDVVVAVEAGTSVAPTADTSLGEVSCSHSARLVPHSRTPMASPFGWSFVMAEKMSGRSCKAQKKLHFMRRSD